MPRGRKHRCSVAHDLLFFFYVSLLLGVGLGDGGVSTRWGFPAAPHPESGKQKGGVDCVHEISEETNEYTRTYTPLIRLFIRREEEREVGVGTTTTKRSRYFLLFARSIVIPIIMFHASGLQRKNPVIFKQGQGMFTHQLKRLLQKKAIHRYNWDPLPLYDPRKLVHANRYIDPETWEERYDPHWDERAHLVPDQAYYNIPIPPEYKDAYWWRDLQARRVQCPVQWVSHRMYNKGDRQRYDFQDLSFRKKFEFSYEEVVKNAKDLRS